MTLLMNGVAVASDPEVDEVSSPVDPPDVHAATNTIAVNIAADTMAGLL